MPSKRRCVIKVLHPASNNPPELQEIISKRFEREAAVLETLGESIDQIPKLYAYFEEEGEYYLVQELVEGQTLGESVSKEGTMDEATCRQFLTSFLELLDRVHSHGIIHRDIKPSNIIMRARDRKPVLIDFGIVKETVSLTLDKTGNTRTLPFGTKGYSPIEQMWGTPVFASDLYSLGVTTIYLLAGKSPGDTPEMIDPASGDILWRKYVSSISAEFAAILDRAIEPAYRDRYKTARDMLEAVGSLMPLKGPPTPEHLSEASRRSKIRRMVIEGNEAFNAEQFKLAVAKWEVVLKLSPDEPGVSENIKAAQKAIKDEADLQARIRRLITEANQASDAGQYELAVQKWEEFLGVLPDKPGVEETIKFARQKQREAQEKAMEARQRQAQNREGGINNNYQGESPVKKEKTQDRQHEDAPTLPYWQQSQNQRNQVAAFIGTTPGAGVSTAHIARKPSKRRVGWIFMWIGISGIVVLLIAFQVNRILRATPDNKEVPSEPAANTAADAKYNYDLGLALHNQNKYAEAEVAYRKAISIDPNDARYHNNLGDVLYKQNKPQEAEAAFRKAIAINPNKVRYHYNLGVALNDQKRHAEAEAAYRKAISIDPNDADSHYGLGNALRPQNKYAEAEAAYRKALAIDPNDARYYNNLGIVLRSQDKYVEAETAYRKAISINPNDADYHYNLGLVLRSQNKYAEAEAAYKKALAIAPNYTKAQEGLKKLPNKKSQ